MKDLTLFLVMASFPSINAHFRTLWGLLTGGRSYLKLFTLVILNPWNTSERFDTDFSIGIIAINKCPFVAPFGDC